MRVKLFLPKEYGKKVREKLVQNIDKIENEEWDSGSLEMVSNKIIMKMDWKKLKVLNVRIRILKV